MTTIADLAADVYEITRRPDLVNQTTLAIKSATLKMHQIGYFDRDLYEFAVQFDTLDYLQQLPYTVLVPNWRAVKYIRQYFPIDISTPPQGCCSFTNGVGREFGLITPDSIFDEFNQQRSDVMYLSGTIYNLRASCQFQYALIGCYINPILTDAAYASWIADQHRYAIIFEASRIIFKSIGLDQEAKDKEDEVADQKSLIIMSNTVGEGY